MYHQNYLNIMINEKQITAIVISAGDPFLLWVKLNNLTSLQPLIENVIILLDVNDIIYDRLRKCGRLDIFNALTKNIYPNIINHFKQYFDKIYVHVNKSDGGTVGHSLAFKTILKYKSILSKYVFISEDDDFIINPKYVIDTLQDRIVGDVDVCACSGCSLTIDHLNFLVNDVLKYRTDLVVDLPKEYYNKDIKTIIDILGMSASSVLLKGDIITFDNLLLTKAINVYPGDVLEYKELQYVIKEGGTVDVFGGLCYSLFLDENIKHITYFDLNNHSDPYTFNYKEDNSFFHLGSASGMIYLFLFSEFKNAFVEEYISSVYEMINELTGNGALQNLYWVYHYIPLYYYLLNTSRFSTNGELYNRENYINNVNYIIETLFKTITSLEMFNPTNKNQSVRYNNIKKLADKLEIV